MSAPTGEREGAPVETRCSCGAFIVMCKGEYHDCAVERDVALHKRQVEALEAIARRTPSEKQSPAAPAQPGEGEMDVIAGLLAIIDEWRDESEGRRPSPSASCLECTSGTVPNHLNKGPCVEHRARALLERRGKGLSGKGGGR